MIRLRCGNCGQTLEVDDAFAGGVCRCRHCGTIQTVPEDAKAGEAGLVEGAALPGAVSTSKPKPLYRREEQQDQVASGLDELADVVASSGALSSGLHRTAARSRRNRRSPTTSASPDLAARNAGGRPGPDKKLIGAIAAAAGLAVVVVILAIALLGDDKSPADGNTPTPSRGSTTLAGIPLQPRISFVVDTGSATQEDFAEAMALVLDVVEKLPGDGAFQIVLWPRQEIGNPSPDPTALPSNELRTAGERTISNVRDRIAGLPLGGSTTAVPALRRAIAANPDMIVLITGNTAFLGDDFARSVLTAWREAETTIPVHTIAVGTRTPPSSLGLIADETGGTTVALSQSDLRQARRELGGGS